MGANAVALPPGFTLDAPVAAALPEGFTLDATAERGTPLPANAGLAKLGTGILGLPVDTIENVLNLGLAGAGTVATAAGRPDLAPDLLKGSVGGSQWLQERARATGEPGLSPDNPTPQSASGTAQYDFVSRGGILPGGALPAAGSMVAERLGGPEWAGVGAMAPSAATTAFNATRAPTLRREQQHNAVRDDTWKEAQEAGYKVPPSEVRPTFIGNRAESVAGKHALNQQAVDENQVITDNLARRAAKLPEGAPITVEALEARRKVLAEPYRQVAGLSPIAKAALQKLGDTRADARAEWQHFERSKDPKVRREAEAKDRTADALERVLEREAQRHGRSELIPELRQARTDIARTHDVQRALNRADGHVDPRDIFSAWDRGAKLEGDLLTIAKFTGAFPQASRLSSKNPTPGVSALEPVAAAGLGVMGAGSGAGWMPMGVPLVSAPTRAGLLSDTYQRAVVQPNYEPMMLPQGTLQSLAQQAILAQQQQEQK